MGLSLRHFDCNNVILNMLRSPSYGLAIPPLKCFKWETAIANAVINNMKEKDGIYIPTNIQKDVFSMFHIDNIDWLEDTPDGKKCITLFTDEHFSKKYKDYYL